VHASASSEELRVETGQLLHPPPLADSSIAFPSIHQSMHAVNRVERRGKALPVTLVLGAIGSVQLGAAFAFNLFDDIGPAGTVFLRVAFAAVVLMAIARPAVRGHAASPVRDVVLFGAALALMNLAFYEALDRIPLGVGVTFEFVGPLGVAIATSHRRIDLLWAVLAAGGIVLLSGGIGGDLDALGVALALTAGAFWAAYILLSQRVGRAFPRADGLALALVVSTAILVVPGIAVGGAALLDPALLAAGFAVAMLSSAIPYSLELEALRHLPTSTFGVLMSLEPGVAAMIGFVVLDQGLELREVVAIAMVVAASAGALSTTGAPPARDA
jgi:inner membrane transporter RhtA